MTRCLICKKELGPIPKKQVNINCLQCGSTFPIRLLEKCITLEGMEKIKRPEENITIATHLLVDQYEKIANDFMLKIFKINRFCITDESSLLDFNFEIIDEKINRDTKKDLKKIEEVYGVDVSDIEKLNLIQIFERLRLSSPILNP